ncbi:MAG: DUF1853 family protein [Thiotrichales bacterium]|nr:MAG: DUF1853 family protein [Thiotrichales bacterium]
MTPHSLYQHRCVADLAWAVSSPPLLSFVDSDCVWFDNQWYRDQHRYIEQQLRQLDRDPVRLQGLLAAQKDQRLGNYFETLWSFALELNPRYQLIERNLQIIDGERTLGEMDFIVRDNETGRCAHWELAVKFYLGVGNTVNHDAWHGPRKKDRLDLKVDHLLGRQTSLSTHPVARSVLRDRGIMIDDCAVILKGRLFYPWQKDRPDCFPANANPSHLGGSWLTREQFMHCFGADSRFRPLIRSGWMADFPLSPEASAYTSGELLQLVDNGPYRLPLHVTRLEGMAERERLFIVGNDWPDL